ncbi:MAG: glycosyltransferase [Gemmatimonadales bacterium]|nr:glycosyltransferase [Gemmatimonadales bacterium]
MARRTRQVMTMERPLRVLFIHPGPVPPKTDPAQNAVACWPPAVMGELMMPSWRMHEHPEELAAIREHGLNDFGFEPLPVDADGVPGAALRKIVRFVRTGTRLSREKGEYDLVFCYGALSTGLAGWLLSRRLRVPLVLDFPGHPFKGILHGEGRFKPMRVWLAKEIARFLAKRAQHVKLLYHSQLDDLHLPSVPPVTVGHDFTPVSKVPYSPDAELPEILLLGYPWHLKGVDILIKAFHLVAEKHQEVRLRIIGHCPDRTPFELLAAGHPRISLEKAVPSHIAYAALSRCRVYVSASRTEAFARVLLEAGAAGRATIASRVDGSPHLIQDGVNGLLFESENVADLAEKLDRLLSDAALRRTLGENGRRIVMEKYSEKEYARQMITLFYQVLGREPPPELGATAD